MYDGEYGIINVMKALNIKNVLDVGANSGQFGQALVNRGFGGVLVSFEPLADCYQELLRLSRPYPNWHCFNLALGAEEGETVINVSGNRFSSSILAAKAWSVEAHAPIAAVAQQPVTVRRLDSLWQNMWSPAAPRPLMLKIDVQGFEPQVLEGLGRHLDEVDLLLIETALVPSYEGAQPFEVMVSDLRSKGLHPVWIGPGWGNPQTGQIFECDIAFARDSVIK
jgi:FkbM family methyltransferase